jgi:hypothetical protein
MDTVKKLERFDYYALSKLLMDKLLKALANEGLLENTIVIRPGSMIGTGLQKKDDPAFIAAMIKALFYGQKETIWKERAGYYVPLSTVNEILKRLILIPDSKITNKIEFINILGRRIPQIDFYKNYIKPAVAECLGITTDGLKAVIEEGLNPNPSDAVRYSDSKKPHEFITEMRIEITDAVLHETVKEIAREIISELSGSEEEKIPIDITLLKKWKKCIDKSF